jgi:hypothetical protein
LWKNLVAETRRQNADWLTTQAESRLLSHLSSYLLSLSYIILSFRVANFLLANSQHTQQQFITGMTCKCIVLLFFL